MHAISHTKNNKNHTTTAFGMAATNVDGKIITFPANNKFSIPCDTWLIWSMVWHSVELAIAKHMETSMYQCTQTTTALHLTKTLKLPLWKVKFLACNGKMPGFSPYFFFSDFSHDPIQSLQLRRVMFTFGDQFGRREKCVLLRIGGGVREVLMLLGDMVFFLLS